MPIDTDTPEAAELLLLATERQVFAFNLTERPRVTIGRHESNDLTLASRTVSNFHAEIVKDDEGYAIRDLGSTNGTHVNGQKVDTGRIANGARIRIGNHVMTMQVECIGGADEGFVRYRKSPQVLAPGTRGRILSLGGKPDRTGTIRGMDPNDFTFPDLLKGLCANGEPVRAVVCRSDEKATVWVRKQNVFHAEYGSAAGEKALYRLFRWRDGSYVIEALAPEEPMPRSISLPVDALVLEGMRNSAELGQLIGSLPPMEAPLHLKEDCPLPLTAHTPEEIEMFQLLVRYQTIAAVLEQSALADARLLRLIDSLLRKGVFETQSPQGTFDETVYPAWRHDA